MELEDQQALLISQLKDLIRRKDEEAEEKVKLLKEAESKLTKARLQVKAKDAKLQSLMKKQDDESAVHINVDQKNRAKLMVQQKRIEEKEEMISKQQKALREKEERFIQMEMEFHSKHAELSKQFKDISKSQGMEMEPSRNDTKHSKELFGAIMEKDQKIAELTAKLDERNDLLQSRQHAIEEFEAATREAALVENRQNLAIESLNTKVEDLGNQLFLQTQTSETHVSRLKEEVLEANQKVDRLTGMLEVKKETVEVKEEQLLQMKREHDASIIDAQEETLEQDQLIRSLKRQLHEREEVLAGKDKVVELLQHELQDKAQEHEEFRKTINILQQNLRETVEGRQLLIEEVKSLQSQPDTVKMAQALQQYKQAIKQMSEDNMRLTDENNTLTKLVQSLEVVKEEIMESKEVELANVQAAMETLNDQKSSLQEKLVEFQRWKEENARAVEVRMKTVLDQLDSQTKVLEKQTAELDRYKQRFAADEHHSPPEMTSIDLQTGNLQLEIQSPDYIQVCDEVNKGSEDESHLESAAAMELQQNKMESLLEELRLEIKEKENLISQQSILHDSMTSSHQLSLERAEEELANVQNELKLKTEQLMLFQKQAKLSKEELNYLQSDISQLCNVKQDLESRNQGLEIRLDEVLKSIESSKLANQTVVESLNDEVSRLRANLKSKITKIEEIEKLTFENEAKQVIAINDVAKEMSKKVAGLNQELVVVRSEKEAIVEELAVVRSEKEAIGEELAVVRSEKEAIIEELAVVRSEKEAIGEELAVVRSEKEAIVEELAVVRSEKEAIDKKLAMVRNEKETIIEELAVVRSEKETIGEELAVVRSEKEAIIEELAVVRSEKEAIGEELAVVRIEKEAIVEELAVVRSEKEAIDKKLSMVRSEKETIIEELAVVRSEKEAIIEELAVVRSEKEAIGEELAVVRCEKEAIVEELAVVRSEKEAIDKKLAMERSEKETIIEELAVVRSEKETIGEELAVVRIEKEAIGEELAVVRSEKEAIGEELAVVRSEKEAIDKKLAMVRSEKETIIEELAVVRSEKETIGEELAVVRSEKKAIGEELAVVRIEKEAIGEELAVVRSEKEAIGEELAVVRSEKEAIDKKLAMVRSEKETIIEELAVVRSEKETIGEELAVVRSEKKAIGEELAVVRIEKEAISEELAVVRSEKEAIGEELVMVRSEKEAIIEELAVVRSEKETIGKELAVVRSEKETLLKACTQAQEDTTVLSQKVAALKEELSLKQANFERTTLRLSEVSKELQSCEVQVLEKLKEIDFLKLTASSSLQEAAQNELMAVKEDLNLAKTELAELQTIRQSLEASVAEKEQLIIQINAQFIRSEAELAQTKLEKEDQYQLIENLRVELQKSELKWKDHNKNEITMMQHALEKKDTLLQEVSEQCAKLQIEVERTKVEYERWKVEEVEHAKTDYERMVMENNTQTEKALKEVDRLQSSLDQHNSKLESRLAETEEKLVEMQQENLARIPENHQFQEMRSKELEKQSVEFLQMQLEELADDQEAQSRHHETVTSQLNDTIQRLREEKQQLLEAFEKQSESLKKVLKRYEEKDLEWNALNLLVEEQNRSLLVAKTSQEDLSNNSRENWKDLQKLEVELAALREKYQMQMDEMSAFVDEKTKCENELTDLKESFQSLQSEKKSLEDEMKKKIAIVAGLKKELESAVDGAEAENRCKQEEIDKLKQQLRSKDEEINTWQVEYDDSRSEIVSLQQSMLDKKSESELLQKSFEEVQGQVVQLSAALRERDTEAAAQQAGDVEQAKVRAQDLAVYVNSLESRNEKKEVEINDLKSEVDALRNSLSTSQHEEALAKQSIEQNMQRFQLELTNSEEKYQDLLAKHRHQQEGSAAELEKKDKSFKMLEEKYEVQVSEVNKLTSVLEKQIQESNDHHLEEVAELRRELEGMVAKQEAWDEEMATQIKKLEASGVELREKNQLCAELQSACRALEEELDVASSQCRAYGEETAALKVELSSTLERLHEKEVLVKRLGAELSQNNEDIRELKESLSRESTRQVQELDSVVTSRLNERDELLQTINEENAQLTDVIKQKEDEFSLQQEKLRNEVEAKKDLELKLSQAKESEAVLLERLKELDVEASKKEESWLATSVELENQMICLREEAGRSSLEVSKRDEEIQELNNLLNQSNSEKESALQEQAARHDAQKEKAKKIVKAQQIQMKHLKEDKEKLQTGIKQLEVALNAQSNEEIKSLKNEELLVWRRKAEESEMLATSLREQIAFITSATREEAAAKDELIQEMKLEVETVKSHQTEEKEAWKDQLQELVSRIQNQENTALQAQDALEKVCKQKEEMLQCNKTLLQSLREKFQVLLRKRSEEILRLREMNQSLDVEKQKLQTTVGNLLENTSQQFLENMRNLGKQNASQEEKAIPEEDVFEKNNTKALEKVEAEEELWEALQRRLVIGEDIHTKNQQKNNEMSDVADYGKLVEEQALLIFSLQETTNLLLATIQQHIEETAIEARNDCARAEEEGAILQDSLRSTVDELNMALQKAEQELGELRCRYGTLSESIDDKDEIIARLSKEQESLALFERAKVENEQRINELVLERNTMKQRFDELTQLQSSLSEELDNSRRLVSERDTELDCLKERCRVLRDEMASINNQNDELKSRSDSMEEKNVALNLKLEKQSEEMKTMIMEKNDELDSAQSQLQEFKLSAEQINSCYDAIMVENNELKKIKLSTDEQKLLLESEVTILNEKLTEKVSEVKECASKLLQETEKRSKLTIEAQEIQKLNTELHQEIACLSKVALEKEEQVAENARRSEDYKHQLSLIEEELQESKSCQDQLVAEKSELQQTREENNTKIKDLESALANIESHVVSLQDELKAEKSFVESEKLQQTGDGFKVGNEAMIQLKKELAAKEKSLAESQRKLRASLVSRKSLMAKVKELEAEKCEMESLNDSLSAEKATLSAQLFGSLNLSKQTEDSSSQSDFSDTEPVRREMEKLQLDLEVSSQKFSHLQNSYLDLEHEITELKDQNSKLQSEINSLKDSNKNLTESNACLLSNNDETKQQCEQALVDLEADQQVISRKDAEIREIHDQLREREATADNKLRELATKLEFALNETSLAQTEATNVKHELEALQLQSRDQLMANEEQSAQQVQLLQEHDTLKAENKRLLQTLKSTEEKCNSKLEACNDVLKARDESISNLNEVVEAKSLRITELEAKDEEITKKLVQLEFETHKAQENLIKKAKENDLIADENAQLQENIKIKDEELKEATVRLKSRIESFKSEVAELEEKLKVSEMNSSTDSVQYEQLQQTSAVSSEKLSQTQRKLKAALLSRKELITETKQKDEVINTEREKRRAFEAEVAVLQQTKSGLEKDLSSLESQISAFKSNVSEKEVLLSSLQNMNEKAGDDLRLAKEKSWALEKKVDELTMEVSTLQTCGKDMDEMVSAVEARSKKLEKILAEKTESLRSAQKCIRKLEKAVEENVSNALTKEAKTLQKDCDVLREKCKTLEAEKQEKIQMLEQVTTDFEQEVITRQDLSIRCDDLEKAVSNLQIQLNEMTTRYNNLQIDKESLLEKYEALQKINENREEKLLQESNLKNLEVETMKHQTSDLGQKISELEKAPNSQLSTTSTQVVIQQVDDSDVTPEIASVKLVKKQNIPKRKEVEEAAQEVSAQEQRFAELQRRLEASQEEIENLTTESQELNKQIKKSKILLVQKEAELKNMKKKYDALRRDCDHLNSALQVEKESYEKWRSGAEREKNLLKAKLEETFAQENGMRLALEESKQSCELLKSRCSEVEITTNRMKFELESARSEASIAAKSFDEYKLSQSLVEKELELKLTQAEEKFASQLVEFKGLSEAHKQLTEELFIVEEQAKEELRAMEERAVSAEDRVKTDVASLTEDCEDLRLANSRLQNDLNEKIEELSKSVASAEILSEERNSLKSSFETTETLLRVKEEEYSSFVSKVEEESLLRSEQNEVGQLSTKNETLQFELKNRQTLVSELVSDCMRLKNELAKELSEKDQCNAELVLLRSKTQSLFALKTQYETNENHLKSELAEKDRIIHKQQEEVNAMRNDHDALLREFGASSFDDLQVLLVAYVDDIKALKLEITEKNEQIQEMQRTETELLEDKDNLTHKLLDCEAELSSIDKKLEEKEKNFVELLHKCSSLEERDFVVQEELDESRRSWEQEKTSLMLELSEKNEQNRDQQRLVENSSLEVEQLNGRIEVLTQEAAKNEAKLLNLRELLQRHQNELEEQRARSHPINEKLTKLKERFDENSVLKKTLCEFYPPLVIETHQQTSPGDTDDTLLSYLDKQLQQLSVVLQRNLDRNISESRVEHLEGQVNMSNVKINEQNSQLHEALAKCEQFHSQLAVASSAMQQYQGQYNLLHVEYAKVKQELESKAQSPAIDSKLEHTQADLLRKRLEEATAEKDTMSQRLLQMETQLRAEEEHSKQVESRWKEEVELLSRNARHTTLNIGDHEEAVPLKPLSFTRKVSKRSQLGRWMRSCSHFRPYSPRLLLFIYALFLHVFVIKCAAGL